MATAPPRDGQPRDVSIRDGVMAGASSCYTIGDDRKWLDCYYGAAQPIRAELGLSPAPQANALAPHSAGQLASSAMAQSEDKISKPSGGTAEPTLLSAHQTATSDVGDIVSRMASYSFDHYGIFTVTLSNGQVWRQLSGDTNYAHWKKAPGAYLVSISSGFLGSRKFEIQGTAGIFRVRQIK